MYTKLVDGKVYVARMDSQTYDEIQIYEEEIDECLDGQMSLDPNSETYEKDFEEFEEHIYELYERIDEIVQQCDIVK